MKYIKYATVILPLCLFFGFILYSSHLLYQPGAVLVWNTILSVSQSSRVSVFCFAAAVWWPTGICHWPPSPLLFLLYAAEVFDNRYIIASFQLTGHSYADEYAGVRYRSSAWNSASCSPPAWRNVSSASISGWGDRLKLNAEKTQLLWLGNRQQLAKLTIYRLPLVITASSSTVDIVSIASNLGIK